ncbi:MAG: response regulator, partial [Chloroflexi bacterium]
MTKILLVEDDKSLREIYGVRLLAEGYDIVSAGDGEDALAMAIKERPTLIVSDVMMPKISGFDMLDILRSTTETRDIKVIMMTALSSEDQRARGEQLGADRYLVKSQVGIEDVVRTVHEVLGDQGSVPAPQAQPVSTAPEPQQQQAAPVPAPQQQPEAPQPQAMPAPSSLPQPTAPFSSPRPSTLGERIINPIQAAERTVSASISDQIAQELQTAVDAVPAPQPAAIPQAPA